MKLFLILSISVLCVESYHHILKSTKTINHDKSVIPLEIISNYLYKYFHEKQVYFKVVKMSSNEEQNHYQEDIITKLLLTQRFDYFSFNILNKLDQMQRGNHNSFSLIIVDGIASLKKVINESTVQIFHFAKQYLIVITQDVHNSMESLNKIFSITQSLRLLDVNVLIKESNKMMWSLNYNSPYAKDCYSGTVHELERFTQENYTQPLSYPFKNLFSPKLFKFTNCPLFVATIPYQPFVIIKNKDDGSDGVHISGFEVRIVNEITKTLNMTPKYLIERKHDIVHANGTTKGAIGKVMIGGARMAIGHYALTKDRASVMSITRSYDQSSVVFAFVKSNTFVTPLARLLAPFQSSLWIANLSLLIISIVLLLLTKKLTRYQRHFIIGGYRNRTPILNLFSGVIGIAIANPRMAQQRYFGVFAKTITFFWLWFWLIVRSAYQSSLYDFLQSERVTSLYDTYDKVKQSNCNIYAFSTVYIPEDIDKRRIRRFNSDSMIALEKLSMGEWNGVMWTSTAAVDYFNKIRKSPLRLDYTRDRIMSTIAVFYFKKHSLTNAMFDEKIKNLIESGLLNRWLAEYKYEKKKHKNHRAKSLTLMNISGILKITAFMYLINTCVFFLELLSERREWIRVFLDYLTY